LPLHSQSATTNRQSALAPGNASSPQDRGSNKNKTDAPPHPIKYARKLTHKGRRISNLDNITRRSKPTESHRHSARKRAKTIAILYLPVIPTNHTNPPGSHPAKSGRFGGITLCFRGLGGTGALVFGRTHVSAWHPFSDFGPANGASSIAGSRPAPPPSHSTCVNRFVSPKHCAEIMQPKKGIIPTLGAAAPGPPTIGTGRTCRASRCPGCRVIIPAPFASLRWSKHGMLRGAQNSQRGSSRISSGVVLQKAGSA